MIRLVVTIVAVLYLAIILATSIGEEIELAVFYNAGEPFYAGQYRGTFDLLDDAIVEREGTDLQAALATLKSRFKTSLRLEYIQKLDLPKKRFGYC